MVERPKELRWSFATQYAERAKCAQCGQIRDKLQMVKTPYGWFCDEGEVIVFLQLHPL
jgi:hypothetical protein